MDLDEIKVFLERVLSSSTRSELTELEDLFFKDFYTLDESIVSKDAREVVFRLFQENEFDDSSQVKIDMAVNNSIQLLAPLSTSCEVLKVISIDHKRSLENKLSLLKKIHWDVLIDHLNEIDSGSANKVQSFSINIRAYIHELEEGYQEIGSFKEFISEANDLLIIIKRLNSERSPSKSN
jgi:hypothetical protein